VGCGNSIAAACGCRARRSPRPSPRAPPAHILSVKPNWTPDQVKGALMLTAAPPPNVTANALGVGVVKANAAAQTLSPPNPNAALNTLRAPCGRRRSSRARERQRGRDASARRNPNVSCRGVAQTTVGSVPGEEPAGYEREFGSCVGQVDLRDASSSDKREIDHRKPGGTRNGNGA
jgi:hypothetical protein